MFVNVMSGLDKSVYIGICMDCRGVPARVAGIKTSLRVKQVAAGSNHTVLMTADGQVYTCGNNQVK
jgi:alpha-tubulin suppressor-like RCC1 family protein